MIEKNYLKLATGLVLSTFIWDAANGQLQAADLDAEIASESNLSDEHSSGFSISTYLWATRYDGDMTINGQTVDLTGISLVDLVDAGELRFPPLIAFIEQDLGGWGLYFDATLAGLTFGSGDISIGPGGKIDATVDLDFTYGIANTGVVYNLSDFSSAGFDSELDILAGVRFTYYDVDLQGTLNGGPTLIKLEETISWLDGTAGIRLRGENENGYTYSLWGDIGLGAGFSVQALATVGRTWNMENYDLNVFAGYRYLYQDYSSGDDAVDLANHGPIVGVKFNF